MRPAPHPRRLDPRRFDPRRLGPAIWRRVRAVTPGRLSYELYVLLLVVGAELSAGLLLAQHPPLVGAALVAGTAIVALLRLRFPALAVVAGGLMAGVTSGGPALAICVSYGAGYRLTSWRRAVPAFAIAMLAAPAMQWSMIWSAVPANDYPARWALLFGLFMSGLAASTYVILPAVLGRYSAQRILLLQALQERNRHLDHGQALVAEHARHRERARIARDVHDSLGNHLSLISVTANAFAVDTELDEQRRARARTLGSAAHAAMEELRDVVGVLRHDDARPAAEKAVGPTAEKAPPGSRPLARISGLVERARAAGADVRVVHSGEPRPLSAFGGQAAYRAVQEGLTNAHKHAPGSPVVVGLRYESDAFIADVTTGPGREPPPQKPLPGGGQGLIGLGERARLSGGMLRAGPTRDGGFRIAVVLPFATASGGDERPAHAPGSAHPGRAADGAGQAAPGARIMDTGGDRLAATTSGPKKPAAAPVTPSVRSARPAPATPRTIAQGIGLSLQAVCVLAVAVLVLAGLSAAAVYGSNDPDESGTAAPTAPPGLLSPAEFAAIRIGDPQADTERKLAGAQAVLAEEVTEAGGPLPMGARCRYYLGGDDHDAPLPYRICFANGRVVEKKILTLLVE